MKINLPSLKKMWLLFFMFISIFQPPILPFSTLYLWGIFTLFLIAKERYWKLNLKIPRNNGTLYFYKALLLLSVYCVCICIIDIFSNDKSFLIVSIDRIRWLSRFWIMTPFELLFIWYIHAQSIKKRLSRIDILDMLGHVGAIQGICAILAYIFPTIRTIFLFRHDDIMNSAYMFARRGYGLSGTLFDTFGYGMGLIAGIILLSDEITGYRKFMYILLSMISTILNARTGIVVFLIAVMLYFCRNKTITKIFFKSCLILVLIFLFLRYLAEPIISMMIRSHNATISWTGIALKDVLAFSTGKIGVQEASFFSDFNTFPQGADIIIGTGHGIFGGISKIIGFDSDVGYINMLWEFGIIGCVYFFAVFLWLMRLAYMRVSYSEKVIIVFLVLAYFVVLTKAVLIGYNPGTIVTYIVMFSFIFLKQKEQNNMIITHS